MIRQQAKRVDARTQLSRTFLKVGEAILVIALLYEYRLAIVTTLG